MRFWRQGAGIWVGTGSDLKNDTNSYKIKNSIFDAAFLSAGLCVCECVREIIVSFVYCRCW